MALGMIIPAGILGIAGISYGIYLKYGSKNINIKGEKLKNVEPKK